MGRASVPLAQFVTEEGLEDEFWVPLGKGDWTNLGGPVGWERRQEGGQMCCYVTVMHKLTHSGARVGRQQITISSRVLAWVWQEEDRV